MARASGGQTLSHPGAQPASPGDGGRSPGKAAGSPPGGSCPVRTDSCGGRERQARGPRGTCWPLLAPPGHTVPPPEPGARARGTHLPPPESMATGWGGGLLPGQPWSGRAEVSSQGDQRWPQGHASVRPPHTCPGNTPLATLGRTALPGRGRPRLRLGPPPSPAPHSLSEQRGRPSGRGETGPAKRAGRCRNAVVSPTARVCVCVSL